MMDQDLVSFVVRFVREASEEQQARWRGVVKHVQSNTEASFSQFSEALAFMQGYVNEIAQSSLEETAPILLPKRPACGVNTCPATPR
jgi:hypothetical protein